jgi:hypothetical protein
MTPFFALMIIGLIGMVLMAVPGLNRHGHGGLLHGHGGPVGHALGGHNAHAPGGHAAHGAPATASGAHGHTAGGKEAANASSLLSRLIPSPRVVFSLLTAYGAFGYALVGAMHLTPALAAWVALIPALLLERFALEPLWQAMLQFQGTPCAPLTELVLTEAVAVTPFRNGKGIVQLVREGREVQFSARLAHQQATVPVEVGDRLLVEEVDEAHERVVVSVK